MSGSLSQTHDRQMSTPLLEVHDTLQRRTLFSAGMLNFDGVGLWDDAAARRPLRSRAARGKNLRKLVARLVPA
jgi:hypothetical protein